MKKYLVEGYIIVQGQKIHLYTKDIIHHTLEAAAAAGLKDLKTVFEKTGDIVEFDNCAFEKAACSGIYVEIKNISNAYSLLQRFRNWWPLRWK